MWWTKKKTDSKKLSPAGKFYGHNKSPFDPRDKHFASTMPKLSVLPASMSWLEFMGPVRDQSTAGCCTGEAGHYMREFLTNKWVRPKTFVELSPMFLYQNAVVRDGQNPATDPGATIRSVMQVLQKNGAAPETSEPFDANAVGTMPSAQAYLDAKQYLAGVYKGLYSLTDIKQCLTQGFVFNLGFDVYDSFETDAVAQTGIMVLPQPGENLLGGHAVCAFGYDDNFVFPESNQQGAILIRNSWGSDWGHNGNFYMPYSYLTSGRVSEAWMIHLGPIWS